MKKILLTLSAATFIGLQSQAQINWDKIEKGVEKDEKKAEDAVKSVEGGDKKDNPLSNEEVVKGLKEALQVGTNNSTASTSKVDGFYKNPKITIPFPPDAQKVKDRAIEFGLKPKVDQFEMNLNRAAEEASKTAATVFIDAITSMTVGDGFTILKGADNAATQYLRDKTTADLVIKFKPIVQVAIDKVELTKSWKPIVNSYNRIPGVEKQNPDLNDYVTRRALEGLFLLIQDEELKIRKEPVARVSDILKRVFSSLDVK